MVGIGCSKSPSNDCQHFAFEMQSLLFVLLLVTVTYQRYIISMYVTMTMTVSMDIVAYTHTPTHGRELLCLHVDPLKVMKDYPCYILYKYR